jgi:hypothetical protein
MMSEEQAVEMSERFASLEDYARAASIALMQLSGGGSEMFTRIGDEFYAIPALCVDRARHREEACERLSRTLSLDSEAIETVVRAAMQAEPLPGYPLENGDEAAFRYGCDCAADAVRSALKQMKKGS